MVKAFRETYSLLTRQQTSVFSAATIIMTTVVGSRFLGLLRDRLLAARFTPEDLGVYYAAFRLPNMLFELLVMGSLATAFIPVFTSYLDTKKKERAFEMASSVINIGVIIFGVCALPLLIFTPKISGYLAPGFSQSQIEMMSTFTRAMIILQVFPLIIGNFFTGILQSFRNFLLPSLAPLVYNVGIILAILFLTPVIGLSAPVLGVGIGALLFLAIQIPAVASFGYKHSWTMSIRDPGTRTVGKLMLPRTLGLAVSQIDTTVDLVLATLLGASSVTVFNFAQHLQYVPVGLFGASIAQACLPALSSAASKNARGEYKKLFLSSFHNILFFVLPISSMLIILRIPIVRLVFGASNLFDWESTVATGKTVALFSISLFAQALIHLLVRGFYALQDSKTPVVVGIYAVGVNTTLSILFIPILHLPIWSLGLSASLASILHLLLLLFYLDRKVGRFTRYELYMPAAKMLLAAVVSGVSLYIPIKLLDQLVFDTTRTINLLMLTGISTALGVSVYVFLAWFLDIPHIAILLEFFRGGRGIRKGTILDIPEEVS